MKVEIVRDGSDKLRVSLEEKRRSVRQGLAKGINAATIALSSIVKVEYLSGQLVQRRTGKLSGSVHPRMESELVGVVSTGREVPYAKFVALGTRPHRIEARNAKALAFPAGGSNRLNTFTVNGRIRSGVTNLRDVVFRRGVNHPGTKATHFLAVALNNSVPRLRTIIQKHVSAALAGEANE